MRRKEAGFTSRLFQLSGKQAPLDAPCEEQSITLVTKYTFVYFTLSAHYMSLISMGIKYLAPFLVENILKLKLPDTFLAGLLICFKCCF